jgi:hypothetical protein
MTPSDQADGDELAAQTARLEAALERIARLAAGGGSLARAPADIDVTRTVAERLDNTIARLRAAIGEA